MEMYGSMWNNYCKFCHTNDFENNFCEQFQQPVSLFESNLPEIIWYLVSII